MLGTLCYPLTHMLAGDVLFILLEYLFRLTAFAIRRRISQTWPLTQATVTGVPVPKSGYNHVVELDYQYKVEGKRFAGKSKIPFVFRINAEICAKQFVTGKELTIRVKPGDPSVSVVHKNYRL